jgi:hypothetical protein
MILSTFFFIYLSRVDSQQDTFRWDFDTVKEPGTMKKATEVTARKEVRLVVLINVHLMKDSYSTIYLGAHTTVQITQFRIATLRKTVCE